MDRMRQLALDKVLAQLEAGWTIKDKVDRLTSKPGEEHGRSPQQATQ
jgi:hypothetical protein